MVNVFQEIKVMKVPQFILIIILHNILVVMEYIKDIKWVLIVNLQTIPLQFVLFQIAMLVLIKFTLI